VINQHRLVNITKYELRYYSLETPKCHCRCNHTRVLLCRKLCANHATSTALHMQIDTPVLCRPHMDESSFRHSRPWQVRGPMQDRGAVPISAVALWRHRAQSTVPWPFRWLCFNKINIINTV